MKNILTAAAFALTTSTAFAGTYTQFATVVDSYPVYTKTEQKRPVEKCRTIEVPIYQSRTTKSGGSTGNSIVGAIIGGAIGNQFGGGSGKDAATILGAIIGADTANRNATTTEDVIVGYREENRCETKYVVDTVKKVSYYVVRAEYNGMPVEIRSNKPRQVGDNIQVQVTISKG